MAMTAPHRNSLQRCRVALEQDLQPDSLFSYLIQESVLAVDTVDEIKLEGTRLKKSQKLLDILPTFGDHAFHVFCLALGETGQGFLSDLIQQDVLESSQDVASPYQGRENLVKILAEELKHYYLETLSRVYPIPWCDWLEVDLQHIFTNLVIEETNR
ncbi:caspase-2 [Lingula anatina]|nr:caspase-2 [Lingula anatina]XP_013387552.1 caspase-2 [Lingula anatina]|eukprot:XP_013387550.1 caspase-2 [Lingula anatina]